MLWAWMRKAANCQWWARVRGLAATMGGHVERQAAAVTVTQPLRGPYHCGITYARVQVHACA